VLNTLKMRYFLVLVVFVTAVVWLSHGNVDSETAGNDIEDDHGEDTAYEIRSVGDVVKQDNGLVVTTISAPAKCIRQANYGNDLSVHYVGRFDSKDGEVFESSRTNNKLFNFQLGAGRVIQCYEQGVPGMCQGETRTLQCPPHLAYGERGAGATIPGDATLNFTVELVNIQDGPVKARTRPVCYERGKPRDC